jgi:hypothetical protein
LKVDDDVFLLLREHSTLQSGPQVVDPAQAAALAVSLETFEEPNPNCIAKRIKESHQKLHRNADCKGD